MIGAGVQPTYGVRMKNQGIPVSQSFKYIKQQKIERLIKMKEEEEHRKKEQKEQDNSQSQKSHTKRQFTEKIEAQDQLGNEHSNSLNYLDLDQLDHES